MVVYVANKNLSSLSMILMNHVQQLLWKKNWHAKFL